MSQSSNRLRAVAVGAGYFSDFHYDAWSRIPEVDLVAVCDLDRQKASRIKEQYDADAVYDDVQQMLLDQSPDFIDIITRPESHLELVRMAAGLGIDVICQKPLAPTFEEAQQLVAEANARGIRLMVHENFRFQPWYREMRTLLDDGVIGETLHSLSVRTRTGDGWQDDAYQSRQPYFTTMPRFLIHETGVHFIDTFRFLAGEVDGVFASTNRLNRSIVGEDAAIVMFEFESGARGLWDASRFNETNRQDPRYTFGECWVDGAGGSIRLDGDGTLTVQRLSEDEYTHEYEHSKRGFAGDCVYATQKHFVDAMLSGDPFETSGEEYVKTLRVEEAIYKSAEEGLPIRGLTRGDDDANH